MSYKPKFCCQCGEKIERVGWNPLTSRRFCELCETEFGIYDKAPLIAAVGILLFGLVGWGNYLRTPVKSPEIASGQSIYSSQISNKTEATRVNPANSAARTQKDIAAGNTANESVPTKNLTTRKPEIVSNSPSEISYFCGASTKKGTPCSRRVKGGGRCWQHQGQAAILPTEKLIVSNK